MTRTLFARLRPIAAGRLRHRIAIDAAVDMDDGAGGATRTYVEQDLVWGAVEPLEADAAMTDARPNMRLIHRITLRWRADIGSATRLRCGARAFRVLAVADADERRRRLTILAEEEKP